MKQTIKLGIAALSVGLLASIQTASALTVSASSGTHAASATFTIGAGTLTVTLANTSASDVLLPTDVLTALFFSTGPGATLTPVSAVLASGSAVFYDPNGPVTANMGGEWAYGSGLVGVPHNATQGISSAGFGPFGSPNFNGPDLAPPNAVDGLQYGLLSAGDNTATGNGGANGPILGSGGLVKSSVVFTLSFTGTLTEGDITDISFQYGTALTDLNVPPPGFAPDNGSTIALAILGAAFLGLSAFAFRNRRAAA